MKKTKNAENISSVTSNNKLFPRLMISPTVLVLLVMTAYPVIFTIYYSFTNYNYLKKSYKFILFDNYVKLLTNHNFQIAIWNTVKFCILAMFFEVSLGLLLAVFVNSFKRGQKVLRTIFLLPYLLPNITIALTWKMMLSNNYGIINQILQDVLINGKPISDEELKELVGHKPIEVVGGVAVGLAVSGLYILIALH